MEIIYREKIPTYAFISGILLVSCLIFLVILISGFIGRQLLQDAIAKIVVVIVFLLNLLVLVSFRELSIEVDAEFFKFGFGKFSKRIPLNLIESVEIGEYKFLNYLGYGIRYGRDKTLAYAPRGGQGLKIKIKNKPTAYFISTAKAEELKQVIASHKR